MKKKLAGLTFSFLLAGTMFMTTSFAQDYSLAVGKDRVVGRLDEQWASTITIKEEKADSWKDKTTFKLVLPKGISWNAKTSVAGVQVKKENINKEDGSLTFEFTKANDDVIDLFYVSPYLDIDRKAELGNLEVDVYINNEKQPQTVKIADLADYGVSLAADEKVFPMNSTNNEVYVELGELIKDTFMNETMGTISIENAAIVKDSVKVEKILGDKDVKIKEVKDNYFDFDISKGMQISKWGFKFKIDPKKEYTGDIVVKFEAHGVDSVKQVLANVEKTIESEKREVSNVILGKTKQEVNDVVFVETRGGSLSKGDYTLKVTPEYRGLSFEKDIKIDYDKNDMTIEKVKADGSEIHFSVTSESRRPQKITLTNILVNMDRAGLDGEYKLQLVSDKDKDAVIAETVLFAVNPGEKADKQEKTEEPQTPAMEENTKKIVFKIDDVNYKIVDLNDSSEKAEKLEAAPFIEGGRTYLPVRAIGENLGLKTEWNAEAKSITITSTKEGVDTKLILTIGNKEMIVNGEVKTLEVAPVVKEGRTFLPIRFVIEPFGYGDSINWDADAKEVSIIG